MRMRQGGYVAILFAVIIAGCGPSRTADNDSELRAEYHMFLADSLQAQNALKEAALEYRLVAELYPGTSHYPVAVRNAALLYSNPSNPAVDDSAALQWFKTYLNLPIDREERLKAEIYVIMLERITALRRELNTRSTIIDSLGNANRRLANDLAGRNKRIQDLEGELRKATQELQNLRDVDVRINRRKDGK